MVQTTERTASRGGHSSCLLELIIFFVAGCLALLAVAASVATWEPSRAQGDCQVSEKYPPKVRRWCGLITAYAAEEGLPPDLVAALIWLESGGQSEAYSHSGAVGLMQVMPRDGLAAKFVCRGVPCFSDRPSTAELRDPEYNIRYGTQLLSELIQFHKGNVREGLKSYGPMDVGYGYADAVIALYNRSASASR